jgi:hypothetical protein
LTTWIKNSSQRINLRLTSLMDSKPKIDSVILNSPKRKSLTLKSELSNKKRFIRKLALHYPLKGCPPIKNDCNQILLSALEEQITSLSPFRTATTVNRSFEDANLPQPNCQRTTDLSRCFTATTLTASPKWWEAGIGWVDKKRPPLLGSGFIEHSMPATDHLFRNCLARVSHSCRAK